MGNTIEKRIGDLKALTVKSEQKLKQAEMLKERFPDLEYQIDRWKNEYYLSKAANSIVNKFDARFSCGCCSESAYHIYPYIEIADQKVHSSPMRFFAGNRSYCTTSGVLYDKKVINQLKKHNVSNEIQEKIKILVNKVPEYIDEADDVDDW